jgi:hypothetical protein
MTVSFRALFLILAASVILRAGALTIGVLFAGYFVCEELDRWLTKRRIQKLRDAVYADETSDWKQDPEDSEFEVKGNWSRPMLARNERIMVTRIADLLRRMP